MCDDLKKKMHLDGVNYITPKPYKTVIFDPVMLKTQNILIK